MPVTGPEIDKLVADHSYYAKATIPGGLYKGSDEPTETFGVYATLVTSADVDADKVYNVTKAVFDNFDRFKRLHPAFEHLKQEEMIKTPFLLRYTKVQFVTIKRKVGLSNISFL